MSSTRVRAAEDSFLRSVMASLGAWLGQAADAVLRFRGGQPSPTGVFSTSQLWREQVRNLRTGLDAAAQVGWSEAFGQTTFSSNSAFVLQALDASESFLVGMPNMVHDMITDEIGTGLSNGENLEQIQNRVQMLLSITSNNLWRNRAQTIATTEVTRAANAGAFAAALAAEPTVGPLVKRWNDEHDQKVRTEHNLVDGVEVRLTQPFQVGGSSLQFPGDPTGAPDQVVGCRCDLSFARMP